MKNFIECTTKRSNTNESLIIEELSGAVRFKRNQGGYYANADYYPSDTDYHINALVLMPDSLAKNIHEGSPYDVIVKQLQKRGTPPKFIVEKVVSLLTPLKDCMDDAGIKNLMFFKTPESVYLKKLDNGRIFFETAKTLQTISPSNDYIENVEKINPEDVLAYIGETTKIKDLKESTIINRIATALFIETPLNSKYQKFITPAKVKIMLLNNDGLKLKLKTIISKDTDNLSIKDAASQIQEPFLAYLKKYNKKPIKIIKHKK